MMVYPGDPPFIRTIQHGLGQHDEYILSSISLSSHGGTHVDVAAHMIRGGATVDLITHRQMVLPAWVVSSSDPVSAKPGDIAGQAIQPGEAVLFKTQNSSAGRLHDPNGGELVFLSTEVADCCLKMGVALVGIDSPSVDRISGSDYPVHHKLLGADVLILEGIDLSLVPPGRYELICLPLRIEGGEAAPARALLLEMEASLYG